MEIGVNIRANELSKGNLVLLEGGIYKVSDLEHVKPGKGGAFIQATMYHLLNHKKLESRFRSEDKVTKVNVFNIKSTLFFKSGDEFHFIRNDNQDEVIVPANLIKNPEKIVEGEEYILMILEDETCLGLETY